MWSQHPFDYPEGFTCGHDAASEPGQVAASFSTLTTFWVGVTRYRSTSSSCPLIPSLCNTDNMCAVRHSAPWINSHGRVIQTIMTPPSIAYRCFFPVLFH